MQLRFELAAGHMEAINHRLLFRRELGDEPEREGLFVRVRVSTDNEMLKVP